MYYGRCACVRSRFTFSSFIVFILLNVYVSCGGDIRVTVICEESPSVENLSFILFQETLNVITDRLKACPHLFPKQDTLYPIRKTATKSPVSGYKFAVSGNKVVRNGNKIACFGIQSCHFRQQVWTGLYLPGVPNIAAIILGLLVTDTCMV